jgi:phosphatidylinositol-3-phosphatase
MPIAKIAWFKFWEVKRCESLSHVLCLLRARNLKRSSLLLLAIVAVFSPRWIVAQTALPQPDHVVIVVEENRSYKRIMDFVKDHPHSYLASLMKQGASFTSFHAFYHPSQPNYVTLFSGDWQGIHDDKKWPLISPLKATSLGGELRKKGRTFSGYAEDLPYSGFDDEQSGNYVRKHCPWINFADVPTFLSLPFKRFPKDATGFESLPTLSYVIPNLKNDMHGTNIKGVLFGESLIRDADTWLEQNLKKYAEWAMTHNSLLIVTWDEDDYKGCTLLKINCKTHPKQNRIVTVFVGQMVQQGKVSDTQYTHLDLLRTLEEMYGLPLLGDTGKAEVRPISDIWKEQ